MNGSSGRLKGAHDGTADSIGLQRFGSAKMSATPRVGASWSNHAVLGSMSGVCRRMKEEGLIACRPPGVLYACPPSGKPAARGSDSQDACARSGTGMPIMSSASCSLKRPSHCQLEPQHAQLSSIFIMVQTRKWTGLQAMRALGWTGAVQDMPARAAGAGVRRAHLGRAQTWGQAARTLTGHGARQQVAQQGPPGGLAGGCR